ncbi:MAG: class II aldolase/adducin family protein [Acidobacteriota bacterium]
MKASPTHYGSRPGKPDHFWVNPFGLDFSLIRASDLVWSTTKAKSWKAMLPKWAAFAIHVSVLLALRTQSPAAHAHSMYGKSWSSLGRLLSPITQDACAFYEDHTIFSDFTGVVLDQAEGQRIAAALGSAKAVIMRNHGLLTVGHTVDEAAWWFITMERSCHAQLLAEAVGEPYLINHEHAKLTCQQVGSRLAGWFQFQPLYARITREQPDLLN